MEDRDKEMVCRTIDRVMEKLNEFDFSGIEDPGVREKQYFLLGEIGGHLVGTKMLLNDDFNDES